METNWNYTTLADAYLKRPNYADAAIDAMLSIMDVKKGNHICDIGAGVAHLTLMLAIRGLKVTAVEPNDAMRKNGIKRTRHLKEIIWYEGTGENTGQEDQVFDAVTFGSSFNVCDRQTALTETARILKPKGWFACMWNHRHLDDPIQKEIESIIKDRIPHYGYGTRREEQSEVIDSSGLFNKVIHIDSCVVHEQTVRECVEAWRSHATLKRQAKGSFNDIIHAIDSYLNSLDRQTIRIPYNTNIWIAQLNQ